MNVKETKIKCADGLELAGTIYHPAEVRAALMIAPATGIKKTFYHSFATYMAENNYGVICYVNRGIRGTEDYPINGVGASLVNWGKLDMPAVLEKLKVTFPNHKYHLVGHSAGGQLAGLMHNAQQFNSIFHFASSSGSLRNMKYPFKFAALFFLNVFIPISNMLFGKTNSHWVGMGAPLPRDVAEQWREWCNGRGYAEMDFGKRIKKHYYSRLNMPSLWLHATDDSIATYENVLDMVRLFPNSKAEIISLDPKKLGCKEIGHMNFFRSRNKALWKYALNWLDNY